MSDAQHRFLDEMMPKVGVAYRPEPVDLNAVFGRQAPHIVEIGFGMGQSTAVIAQARPDDDFLGIEVHAPGVGSLCKLIDEGGITNLRIVQHDAVEVLRDMIPEARWPACTSTSPTRGPRSATTSAGWCRGPSSS
jgi:tRNA (guanine-N7-)-methyltransferase